MIAPLAFQYVVADRVSATNAGGLRAIQQMVRHPSL